jgi:hypothetical protein
MENNKGFSRITILLIILVVFVVIGGIYLFSQNNKIVNQPINYIQPTQNINQQTVNTTQGDKNQIPPASAIPPVSNQNNTTQVSVDNSKITYKTYKTSDFSFNYDSSAVVTKLNISYGSGYRVNTGKDNNYLAVINFFNSDLTSYDSICDSGVTTNTIINGKTFITCDSVYNPIKTKTYIYKKNNRTLIIGITENTNVKYVDIGSVEIF